MDSLLSNAQRCGRKADSLVKFGLFDEALVQLDKAIEYLKELKSNNTRNENIQLIKLQIETFDKKMRRVAIKRSESLKKKAKIELIINKKRLESRDDQAAVLIEHSLGSKLLKDERSVIEELVTTNKEYRKVNTFLVNEIELLKQENEQLKVELLKLNMSSGRESMTSADMAMAMNSNSEQVKAIYDKYSLDSIDATFVSDQEDLHHQHKIGGDELEFCDSACQMSGATSSGSFSAATTSNYVVSKLSSANMAATANFTASKTPASSVLPSSSNNNRIDLSKYIDNESDDNTNDEDSDDSHNAPLEFTIDA